MSADQKTISVENVEPVRLLVVDRTAPFDQLAEVVPEACGVVWSAIQSENITPHGRNVVVYHDTECNMEIGVEIGADARVQTSSEVRESTTPGGRVATAAHHGDYAGLYETHEALHEWITREGLQITGTNWEVYGHWSDDPAQLRTDVYYLLK